MKKNKLLKGGCSPVYYSDPEELVQHLQVLVGLKEVGNKAVTKETCRI